MFGVGDQDQASFQNLRRQVRDMSKTFADAMVSASWLATRPNYDPIWPVDQVDHEGCLQSWPFFSHLQMHEVYFFSSEVSAEGCEELLRRVSILEQRVGCWECPGEEPRADLSVSFRHDK